MRAIRGRLVPTTLSHRWPEMPGTAYALVTSVTSNSPAERAGLQVGDMITQVNGKRWPRPAEIALPNRNVITVLRFGEEQHLQALGSNPEDLTSPGSESLSAYPVGLQIILPDEDRRCDGQAQVTGLTSLRKLTE